MSDVRKKSPVEKGSNRNETEEKKSNDQKKEFVHADLIERLIIDAATSKRQQRRRGSATSSNHSYDIDRILDDENNDWFFERILEKFENIRSKKTHRHVTHSSNDFYDDEEEEPNGVERIVERRYYVKKPRLTSKRSQLTSTSDLTVFGRKNRQYSAVSSATAATTICSQCLASTPTYVDNLRDQSDTLRHEINDLKNEIEQLQTSQQEFFQQLRTHFQVKPGSTPTTASTNSVQATIPASIETSLPVPLSTGKKPRSISTESQASSATTTSPSSSEPTTTTTEETTVKPPNPAPRNNPVAPKSLISEFMGTKNPTIVPAPSMHTYTSSEPSSLAPTPIANKQIDSKPSASIVARVPVNAPIISKSPSIVSTPSASEQVNSKPPSIIPTSTPLNGQINSKPSSIAPTPPPSNGQINSKPSSIASTPAPSLHGPINPILQTTGNISSKPSSIAPTPPLTEFTASKNPVIVPTPPLTEFTASKTPVIVPTPPTGVSLGAVNSRTSSIAPTPPIAPPFLSSGRIPIYENELAHRRVLSPRSQIVASSAASIQDSSDSSSGSISPELIQSKPQKIPKDPLPTLRANELNDLVQYSSKLERSGFPPSVNPVITNPHTSSTFWDSVDQYIDNARSTNINIGLPPMARPNNRNRLYLNNNTTKRLDKYDLEIKPQEFIASSAPLLMPPLDILP